MTRLQITEIDHINQLISSADEAVTHYQSLYGAHVEEVFRQRTGPYDNFIFKMGRMTLEVFSPVDPLHSFGKQHQRFGNCWQACLLRVPSLSEAIEKCRLLGIPLVDVNLDRGWAFTDPRVTYFSIQLEDLTEWDKTPSPNPVGIQGLHGFAIAVHDGNAAVKFFQSFIEDTHILYKETRPALNAQAVGIRLGTYIMEIQSPMRDGSLSTFLDKYRQRIRTATWSVTSLDATRRHFADHGIQLGAGDRADSLAVLPIDNLGIEMQFVEA